MWILLICILLNAFIGVIFQLFEKYKVDNFQAIVINYFVCVLTAAVVMRSNPIPTNLTIQPWFWYALGLGALFIVVFNLMALSVQRFSIMIATIFQKMSLIAPAIYAIFVYNESSGYIKWFGIVMALGAIVLISYSKQDNIQGRTIPLKMWLLPLGTFLGSCIIDLTLFHVEKSQFTSPGDVGFIASLFLTAGSIGGIVLLSKLLAKKIQWDVKNLFGGIALGIPNFFSIYLLVLALQQGWEGSLVFPINNVGILIFATLYGWWFFGQKLNTRKVYGLIMAILSIMMIAFGG